MANTKQTAGSGKSVLKLLRGGRSDAGQAGIDFYDYNLLAAVILLTCFGLVMLYSTSAYEASVDFGNDMTFFAKQAGIGALSFFLMMIGSRIDYHFYTRFAGIMYVVSNLLLVATKFIGTTINGARRWIYIAGISFQPAELAKLAIILFLPTVIVKAGRKFRRFEVPAKISVFGIATAFLTYQFTDNLSTGIIIFGITVARNSV